MVNKLWYEDEDDYDLMPARKSLQKYIDLYCFSTNLLKIVEDITLENVGEFLKIMLKHYAIYNIDIAGIPYGIGESLEYYFYAAYKDEFPKSNYPIYPDSDRRSISLRVIEYIQITYNILLPEDVPHLITYIDTPEGEVEAAHAKIEAYFKQFDRTERSHKEIPKREEAIKRERMEAIKNNKPLPIRPMSIELSMCYKKPQDPA